MNLRTITLTTPDKKAKPQLFLANHRNTIGDAVESTLSDGKQPIYLRYHDGSDEWLDSVDTFLYRVDTWIRQRQRDTMDTGLVYLVGGKRYSLKAAMTDEDVWQSYQSANTAARKSG